MLSYAKLKSKPRVFRSLTGITLSEFEELLLSEREGMAGLSLYPLHRQRGSSKELWRWSEGGTKRQSR